MFALRMKDAQQVISTWSIVYNQWQPDSEEQESSNQDSQKWGAAGGRYLSRWFPLQLAQDFDDERGVEFKL